MLPTCFIVQGMKVVTAYIVIVSDLLWSKVLAPILEKFTIKWQDILGLNNIDKDELSRIFKNIKVITLSTKLRSFHYKLLIHATITNVKLLKWNMADTDKCTFCNVEIETIKHLFWDWPTAKHLWNQVVQWLRDTTNQTVHLTVKATTGGLWSLSPPSSQTIGAIPSQTYGNV